MTSDTLLIGDFNLNYEKVHDDNYAYKNMFVDFEEALGEFNMIQLVKFPTWSRIVGDSFRESILDHIYCKDPTRISNLCCVML